MRLATWNVNSIRTRVTRTVEFAVREDIDVLAMQEIKCKPEQFPYGPFEEAGYHVEVHGLNQWNGVAIASRLPITDVRTSFDGMPGFAKGHEGPDAPLEARALGVMVDGVRVWSLYVPNGRSLEDPHYAYKLHWLEQLKKSTAAELSANPDLPLALVGDFNIIPFDVDNGDPDIVIGRSTHVSPQERDAFFAFPDAGVTDVVRPLIPEGFTYWDYQRLKFPRNEGVRIDFVLGSRTLAEAVKGASIHRDERKGEQPSDHVPVVVDLDFGGADDDDDMPMIFS
ncbi:MULTISPECIES: exodeoxyribonuclease III [unclassified Microbacterium]|uniref:exodeoxyribonuclease III n=1 Tax=unclassified Microbacterium TaxID=2609290 RepID=UPI000CFE21E5|nr:MULTISPECIES: exodeoxyribonuclease III [unclassified Microbacterium]PQZ54762.1 exodeoxyribonuclease III [Microbacterium sp. MYb43]PQZ77547.1 exodeoxyribonuclease III [Microbacterium sp. MYb40]PRB19816.1 exodeoxyribonuclease III [Microbacterium sp. MYb54]PRB25813.1 exodeoxyribonuclease III [Microbacterium sp. MYb50]PRB64306.1 exodeoxyribonuclease III [Microbacterium sp. MYb24]